MDGLGLFDRLPPPPDQVGSLFIQHPKLSHDRRPAGMDHAALACRHWVEQSVDPVGVVPEVPRRLRQRNARVDVPPGMCVAHDRTSWWSLQSLGAPHADIAVFGRLVHSMARGCGREVRALATDRTRSACEARARLPILT
jgi:hypothetical protein